MEPESDRSFFTNECHGPHEGRTYGPLVLPDGSRSLGVSFSPPGGRVCSFECVWCPVPGGMPHKAHWPTAGEIATDIANTAYRVGPLDSITICGRGEPTLNPHFAGAAAAVVAEAARLSPRPRLRIVTTGAGATRPGVRRALDLFDERVVHLDAAGGRINRPRASFQPRAIAEAMTLLRDVTVHSCFVGGACSNDSEADVAEWADRVAELEPQEIAIYTIGAARGKGEVLPLDELRLAEIALALRRRTGLGASILS